MLRRLKKNAQRHVGKNNQSKQFVGGVAIEGFEVRGFYLSFYPPTLLSIGEWCAKGVLLFLIGVICVRGVGSWWIIFFFIAS